MKKKQASHRSRSFTPHEGTAPQPHAQDEKKKNLLETKQNIEPTRWDGTNLSFRMNDEKYRN
jgi:hypothetical protein